MWTVEHEADIASDLSAFHRIDDPMTLDGPRYFLLAARLIAYAGVMQTIYLGEQEAERKGDRLATGRTAPTAAGSDGGRAEVVSDTVAIAMLGAEWVEHVVEEEAG